MSESIDFEKEVETLRRVNAELIAKAATRKTKITELEATVTELQGKLSESHDSLHEVTVGGPLKTMAESISLTPELWLEQFNKSHKVEMVKGQLTVLNSDGKPTLNGDKPVPFERNALVALLTNDAHPSAKTFRAITIASRATGGAASSQSKGRTSAPATDPKPQFGLR